MNNGLRPYPEYKDSGLHGLGRIPKHWNEKRAKYFFREVDERSTTGEETLMSVSHKTGVTPRKSNVTMFKAASNVGHKICRPGDLAINTLWAWMAALGVSRETGLVSPAYGVYRQRDANNYHPDFIDFLLRTQPYAAEYRCRSTGITTSRLRLYPIDFLCIPLVQPPRHEQELIVGYLRTHDLLVRKFVRNRRRLIEVLNEQKQAIINHAVTRGLDPAARFKPSGMGWIGDIPKLWRMDRLKYLAQFDNGIAFKPNDWKDSGVPIIRIQNLNGAEHFNYTDRTNLPQDLLIQPGDLMFAWSGNRGTSFGSFLWDREFPAYLNQHIFKVTPLTLRRTFFYYALRAVTAHVEEQAQGIIGLVHITKPELGAIRIPVPSDDEQAAIATFLDAALANLNKAVANARREIELIREYRTQLIADVVTGKLDVRHLAPTIDAVEAGELPPIDADELLDDELPEDDDAEVVEEVDA